MHTNLKSLIGTLNDTCRGALETAAGLCLTRPNYDVEVEHVLLKLVEVSRSDVVCILRHCEVDVTRLARDISPALATPPVEPLRQQLSELTVGSVEETTITPAANTGPEARHGAGSRRAALDQYTIRTQLEVPEQANVSDGEATRTELIRFNAETGDFVYHIA